MYLTQSTLYALRLSFQQGAVTSMVRKNIIERNIMMSAIVLAAVGLSMNLYSATKMLTSDQRGQL